MEINLEQKFNEEDIEKINEVFEEIKLSDEQEKEFSNGKGDENE